MSELKWMMDNFSHQQIVFLLLLKMGVLLFALYGTWQLHKVKRKLEREEDE